MATIIECLLVSHVCHLFTCHGTYAALHCTPHRPSFFWWARKTINVQDQTLRKSICSHIICLKFEIRIILHVHPSRNYRLDLRNVLVHVCARLTTDASCFYHRVFMARCVDDALCHWSILLLAKVQLHLDVRGQTCQLIAENVLVKHTHTHTHTHTHSRDQRSPSLLMYQFWFSVFCWCNVMALLIARLATYRVCWLFNVQRWPKIQLQTAWRHCKSWCAILVPSIV
jgi:hypothetical protein